MESKNLDNNIEDVLIGKPYNIIVGEKEQRSFYLYPVTLGKLYVLKRHIESLGIDDNNLSLSPQLEALRVTKAHPAEVCRIITYHTLKKKRDVFDTALVENDTKFLMNNLSEEEMATLLLMLLTRDNLETYKKHLGIAKENKRMNALISAKERLNRGKSDVVFGGKTIFGTLIDTACERYGWEYDYVLWGIPYVNLCLMLSDKIQSIYLSDEERKNISPRLYEKSISADDKKNKELIKSMKWR